MGICTNAFLLFVPPADAEGIILATLLGNASAIRQAPYPPPDSPSTSNLSLSARTYLANESTMARIAVKFAVGAVPQPAKHPSVTTSCGYRRNPSNWFLSTRSRNKLPPSHNCFSLL